MSEDGGFKGNVSVFGGAETVGSVSCIKKKPQGSLLLNANKGNENWLILSPTQPGKALWVFTSRYPTAKLVQAYLSGLKVERRRGGKLISTWNNCYAYVDVSWSSLINPKIFQFDVWVFSDKQANKLLFYWIDAFFGTVDVNREVSCGSLPF